MTVWVSGKPDPVTLLLLVALLALLALAGCARQTEEAVELQGQTMGTTYSVKLFGPPVGLSPPALQQRIDQRLEWVNDLMSTYRESSELSRFNASDSVDWFPVSKALAELVQRARAISELSGGAFDVTVGPAVNLWGFGPADDPEEQPDDAAIAAAAARIGYRKLDARLDPPALRKQQPDLYVDLSAIAKGYGVDQVAQVLDEAGVTDYLVEIGGELRARGRKPEDRPWRIAIERPTPGAREVYRIVDLTDRAMATSGDYRNFHEWRGRFYSHTIDPATGRPVEHRLASVSVLAADCARADALATALLVLGPERGYDLAEREGIAAFFVSRAENGYADRASPKWERL